MTEKDINNSKKCIGLKPIKRNIISRNLVEFSKRIGQSIEWFEKSKWEFT